MTLSLEYEKFLHTGNFMYSIVNVWSKVKIRKTGGAGADQSQGFLAGGGADI